MLQIHGHLAPYGGIHLGQQGGGDLHEVHPPQDGGGGEPRQIPHHAAAQGRHRVGAGQPGVHHGLPQLGQTGGAFGALPGGDGVGGHLEPGPL